MSPQIAQPSVTQGAKTARHYGPAVSQPTQATRQHRPHPQRLPKAKGLPPENEPISTNQKTVGQTSSSPGTVTDSLRPRKQTAPRDQDHGDRLHASPRRWRPAASCWPGKVRLWPRGGRTRANAWPYYRLAYREDGRQKSIYLGASA